MINILSISVCLSVSTHVYVHIYIYMYICISISTCMCVCISLCHAYLYPQDQLQHRGPLDHPSGSGSSRLLNCFPKRACKRELLLKIRDGLLLGCSENLAKYAQETGWVLAVFWFRGYAKNGGFWGLDYRSCNGDTKWKSAEHPREVHEPPEMFQGSPRMLSQSPRFSCRP